MALFFLKLEVLTFFVLFRGPRWSDEYTEVSFGGATLGSTFFDVVVGQPCLSLLGSVETADWDLFSSLL